MELLNKLKGHGWYLTDEGLKKIRSTINSDDVREIIGAALNKDFREIAGGALPAKREENELKGRIVLQVQKVRNISAPKSNEESKVAPRLLQIDLTDGQATIQALELERVSVFGINMAPGTKILFCADKLLVMHGFLLLKASEIQLLGGRVEQLYEKWELARTMRKYAKSGQRLIGNGLSGPPPWVAFGKKPCSTKDSTQNHRNFKSLAPDEKDKNTKETEFSAMRSEAITIASKAGTKKVFGGGGQRLIDYNIKKILDKGYSEDEAKQALRATNNNLERALYNLKRRNDKNTKIDTIKSERGGKRVGGFSKNDIESSKPAANVSLFDFLTNKLPVNQPLPTNTTTKDVINIDSSNNAQTSNQCSAFERNKFENNISSSFAANRHLVIDKNIGERAKIPANRSHHSDNKDHVNRALNNTDDKRNSVQKKFRKDNRNLSDKRTEGVGRSDDTQKQKQTYENRRLNDRQIDRHNQNGDKFSSEKFQTNPSKTNTNILNNSKNNVDITSNINKLTERTVNLKLNQKLTDIQRRHEKKREYEFSQFKLSSSSQHQLRLKSSQQDMPNQGTTPNEMVAQLTNSNKYDPSKIIGFQSKETNEFAMNVLKSQGVPLMTTSSPQQLRSRSGNSYMPVISQYGSKDFDLPGGQGLLNSSTQFTLPSGENWMWKIGDLCLAKYWDDGRYYEAEITAISDKTFVVLFLGYGNYEEVLKSDCLPFTDSNHKPVNNVHLTSTSQTRFQNNKPYERNISSSNVGNPHRNRADRQVYVPPPKREH